MGVAAAPRSWRVLVTGGAGFIGGHSVERLVAAAATVLVLDDLRHASTRGLPEGTDLAEVDLATPDAARAIKEFRPQAILHLAAQGGVNRSWRNPAADAVNNVLATVNLLQAAVEAGCERVVFASSGGAMYGDSTVLPTPEDTSPAPRSPYGAAKASCEVYVATFARSRGLHALSLRYGNVYGPGQDGTGEAGVVAISSERLLTGAAPVIRGDGLQTRDFVHVHDVASANLLALQSAQTGALNIATGVETSVLQVVTWIAEAAGFNGEFVRDPAPAGEVRRSALDTSEAHDRLGWSAHVALRQGLRHTFAHFRDAAGTQERHITVNT